MGHRNSSVAMCTLRFLSGLAQEGTRKIHMKGKPRTPPAPSGRCEAARPNHREAIPARHCPPAPARHCETHSAVAIHAFVQRPMDCFVPRNDTRGRDHGAGTRGRLGCVIVSKPPRHSDPTPARHCQPTPERHCEAAAARHCEAHSAVAIHAFVQRPMDCFVPRNDTRGRNDRVGSR
jgi:hypothetical protein